MITHDLIGDIHLYAALLAMITGTLILIGKKGTKRHKQIGYCYAVCMLVLNITAFMIFRLFGGFGIFHIAAIISLATLLAGMIPIIAKNNNQTRLLHISFMYWSVMGLYAAFISEVLTRIPDKPFFLMLNIAVGVTMLVAGIGYNHYLKTWKTKFTTKQ